MKIRNRCLWMLLFALGGVLLLSAAETGRAWARPDASPAHQTVPTLPPTRLPSPSAPATSAPPPTATPLPSGTPDPTATGAPPVNPPATAAPSPGSALTLKLSASQAAVVAGQTFQYIAVVQNSSGRDSGPATLRATLSAALELQALRSLAGQLPAAGNQIAFPLDNVPAGGRVQVELTVRVRVGSPRGLVIAQNVELEQDGRVVRSASVSVALPPAYLPPVGAPFGGIILSGRELRPDA